MGKAGQRYGQPHDKTGISRHSSTRSSWAWQLGRAIRCAASVIGMSAPQQAGPAPSIVAAGGLIGGFLIARRTHRRELGGLVFAAAGAFCASSWTARSGRGAAAGLTAGYVAAMGLSHPLAKKIGAWPSVLAVTSAVVGASRAISGG